MKDKTSDESLYKLVKESEKAEALCRNVSFLIKDKKYFGNILLIEDVLSKLKNSPIIRNNFEFIYDRNESIYFENDYIYLFLENLILYSQKLSQIDLLFKLEILNNKIYITCMIPLTEISDYYINDMKSYINSENIKMSDLNSFFNLMVCEKAAGKMGAQLDITITNNNLKLSAVSDLKLNKEIENGNLLIIDKDFNSREILYRELIEIGFNPELAKNNDEALEILDKNNYDYIFLELDDIDKILNKIIIPIVTKKPDVKLILLLENSTKEKEYSSIEKYITAILSKPINPDEIKNIANKITNKK